MGVSQINSQHPLPFLSSIATITSNFKDDGEIYLYNDDIDQKFKNFSTQNDLGFWVCLFVFSIVLKKQYEIKKKIVNNLENNKVWLLAKSGGRGPYLLSSVIRIRKVYV